jgi:hypothetical protein
MFSNLLKQLYFCSFAQHWETILLWRNSSIERTSPILQYLKNTFTFFAKNIYKTSQLAFMPKFKNKVEQLCKSFLKDFSPREGLLPNRFELDTYAKLLEERGDTLS